MLSILNSRLRRLCSRLQWLMQRRSKRKIVIRRFGKSNLKGQSREESDTNGSAIQIYGQRGGSKSIRPIRIATLNAAMFSMAPAVPKTENSATFNYGEDDYLKVRHPIEVDILAKTANCCPKSILNQPFMRCTMNSPELFSKQHKFEKSKLGLSISLPDNEISLDQRRQLRFVEDEKEGSSSKSTSRNQRGKDPLMSTINFASRMTYGKDSGSLRSSRSILEILKEVDADILALQDVKAEEEKGMKPLSDLAGALGMEYVFAESWAPEYGNAILSKWPIKRWKVQKIYDDTDFRNVLKATVDVPQTGEVNFNCTHLDHLNENWRMKQLNAIIQSNDGPHILAGGLNSLEETDYSAERWMDILKFYEKMGKPKPKVEVMRFLKGKQYVDAKDFAGEYVQGTCKYGTRVDYILASPESPYKFIPGSYSVVSSKGTSDHHLVKVDIIKVDNSAQQNVIRRRRQPKQNVVRITNPSSSGDMTGERRGV
ncbi:hypothetical protein HHK36_026630 [Tetracentron sinense]|uniref:Endonuclease/exonuclease/phosphatase domain-containing protein n=1 Tax=Tetracentron sinense TaxID=13715 RepID=A0A835D5N2_TETSI|nr:hypothetical protein HHK36_026630 [Tetracentron sinense]